VTKTWEANYTEIFTGTAKVPELVVQISVS
jgi:hypothetical protein